MTTFVVASVVVVVSFGFVVGVVVVGSGVVVVLLVGVVVGSMVVVVGVVVGMGVVVGVAVVGHMVVVVGVVVGGGGVVRLVRERPDRGGEAAGEGVCPTGSGQLLGLGWARRPYCDLPDRPGYAAGGLAGSRLHPRARPMVREDALLRWVDQWALELLVVTEAQHAPRLHERAREGRGHHTGAVLLLD